ncbi:hypothetical protein BDW42DRAFT_177599 [Aspergillus taichungensis]|uniref:C3H1-type domain-containing protein n=1 Tax=Aspergillus taichungensis TaxID=482145 RepID=A0A2J5HJ21_9EURO|nr:hypothetical protein BDW42DRAFT_177599 [Aspergillus taichungensis]
MTATTYLERYKQLISIENSKNNLIEDLIQRVTELEDAWKQEKLDHERETRFNRDIQIHEMELMDQISRVKAVMDREPFIVVLLDGAGMVFKDEFLQNGEQGGRNAAQHLHTALQSYVVSNFSHIGAPKIMVKLYDDLKGLSESCVRGGVTTETALIEDFGRGFNSTYPLFEFVDIGPCKEGAHDKIGEAFKLYLYNCHCHQIFLGCNSDPAYAEILGKTLEDRSLVGRVSLVEGLPFEDEMDTIKASYRATRFPDLFRDSKMPVWAPWKAAVASKPRAPLTPSHHHNVPAAAGASTNASTTTSNWVQPSRSSSAISQASGDFQVVRSKASISTHPKIVERNKLGQRVDRLDFKTLPRDELNRMKKLKLCNFYHIQGTCPNDNCPHDHARKLTKSEHLILVAIARMTPCRYGLECDDPECMYGHRCPQSEPGRKDCFWGDNCRFDKSAHGVDTNIVKVTKV